MDSKRFQKKDSGFICGHCGKKVEPLGFTSRNHCPFCLWSRHLDELPGDRASECGGLMEPVSAQPDAKKRIHYPPPLHRLRRAPPKPGGIWSRCKNTAGRSDENYHPHRQT